MSKEHPILFIFSNSYPGIGNTYSSNFIHNRVKNYSKDFNCVVLKQAEEASYIFDGIVVITYTNDIQVKSILEEYSPNLVLIHFINRWMITKILPLITIPIVVWIHGVEALAWYRRLFNYSPSDLISLDFYKMIRQNFLQLWCLRKVIGKSNNQQQVIHFVFVSNWMKKMCERDTFIKCKYYSIIPNPIDTKLFEFKPKTEYQRTKILLLRSFESRKYANDIAITAIKKLSKRDYFNSLEITIIGSGRYFKKLTKGISGFSNIKIINTYINNSEIPRIHEQNGIFLCPTRQDAQGVSMCEAMSSGLVPITSNNTAIPEFVQHNVTGFLSSSSKSIVRWIDFIYNNTEVFKLISQYASESVRNSLSNDVINPRELGVFKEYINKHKIENTICN